MADIEAPRLSQIPCHVPPPLPERRRLATHAHHHFVCEAAQNAILPSMLQRVPHDALGKTRCQIGRYSFSVGLFYPQLHAGSCRRTDVPIPACSRLPRLYLHAVEIRNRENLAPSYVQCLRQHGIAHVFFAWTQTPDIVEQICIRKAFAPLRAGCTYKRAIAQPSPHSPIRDWNPFARDAILALIDRATKGGRPAYGFVNKALEAMHPRPSRQLSTQSRDILIEQPSHPSLFIAPQRAIWNALATDHSARSRINHNRHLAHRHLF